MAKAKKSEKAAKPAKTTTAAPVTTAAAPAKTSTLGSVGVASIDQWDATLIDASDAVYRKRGVRVSARFLKAVLYVECGGDGYYPLTQCRPCDGIDCVPACGPFQIKWPYHQYRCKECVKGTPSGEAEMAAHILGMTMLERKTDEYGALLAVYFPANDANGTTQTAYVNKVKQLIATMEANSTTPATTTTADPVITTPAPTRVTPADALRRILGGVPEISAEFAFGGYNYNDDGSPANLYDYGPGHGAGLVKPNQHPGTDIFIPLGTTLYCPLSGVVRCVGSAGSPDWGQGCGYYNDTITSGVGNVTILTDAGLKIVFGHVNKALVSVGQRVSAGQAVATSGGMYSPHLHLECAINAPERVNTAVANYPGGYWMVDPLPAVAERMNGSTQETRPMVRFAGTSVDVPLSVPLRVALLPASQKNQRPGTKMTPDRFIVHETDNQSTGANAAMHLRWLQQGAPDDYGRSQVLSFHLVVDENEVVQMLPFDEIAWHGGDGSNGVCNTRGLSIEITVANKNADKAKVRANAEEVVAAAMLAKNLTTLERHGECCARIGNPAGCHTRCPATMQEDGYWPTFKAHVDSWRFGSTPAIQYPDPVPPPEWDGTDKVVGNVKFWAAERVYKAKQDGVLALRYADRNSTPVRAPLKKDEAFRGRYLLDVAGEQWIVSDLGTRILAADCTPLVTVKP